MCLIHMVAVCPYEFKFLLAVKKEDRETDIKTLDSSLLWLAFPLFLFSIQQTFSAILPLT